MPPRCLKKWGGDYVILEARDRTGGRVLSRLELAGTSAGIHVDMGAAWFWPDIQPDFAHLIERLNLPVIAHGRPGDMLYERRLDSPPERYPAWESSPASFRLKGGVQALMAALKSQIPAEKIKTDHQVVAVSRAGKEVKVHTWSEGSKKALFPGEHVFLALPPALAAKIDFIPAMPEQVLSNMARCRKNPDWAKRSAMY